MRFHRGLRVAVCGLYLVTSSGCTSLREVPRGEYAALPEREHVRVVTRDGLLYQFDYARFGADTVVGFKQRDTGSRVEEYATLGVPLANVEKLSTRQVDWVRTGIVGGVALIGILLGAYKASQANREGGESPGGSPKPPPS